MAVAVDPKRKAQDRKGNSCADLFLLFAFGAFAAITCFYTVQFVFVSLCHLIDLMRLQLVAFGVQVIPFWSTGMSLHLLSYFSTKALPWGLAALGVFTGSKLLLFPIQIFKIQRAYVYAYAYATMTWESTLRNQSLVLASIEAFELAFIFLVFMVMACASYRPLLYVFANDGKKEKIEVRFNMGRSAEEGNMSDGASKTVGPDQDSKVEITSEVTTRSPAIYPVLNPATSTI